MLTAEVLVRLSLPADQVKKRMELCATQSAEKDSTVLDQSAGNLAPMNSEMMVPSAISHPHMEEVQDTLSGTEITARETTHKPVARNGELSTTQDADLISTTLLAVFAHPTALQA